MAEARCGHCGRTGTELAPPVLYPEFGSHCAGADRKECRRITGVGVAGELAVSAYAAAKAAGHLLPNGELIWRQDRA